MQLTWQNLVPAGGTNAPVELRPQDIDTLIRLAGRGRSRRPVLYHHPARRHRGWHRAAQQLVPLVAAPPRLRPRWRSMVTGLSTTGVDLTRNEFLEFWVFQPAGEPAGPPGSGW